MRKSLHDVAASAQIQGKAHERLKQVRPFTFALQVQNILQDLCWGRGGKKFGNKERGDGIPELPQELAACR